MCIRDRSAKTHPLCTDAEKVSASSPLTSRNDGRMWAMAHPRAGQPALPEDLIDVDAVISAYYDLVPDPGNPDQQVVFGTSGHRGSSLDTAFNDAHIAATTQAIVEYRAGQGVTGPLYIGTVSYTHLRAHETPEHL